MESKADKLNDEHQRGLRLFDYADAPIKEWIADYLEEEVNNIFDDFNDETEILNINVDDKYYTLYLSCFPNITDENPKHFNVDLETAKSSKNIQKAIKNMTDAVYTVFPPIVHTMSQFKNKMEMVAPIFNPENMSFKLVPVNLLGMEKHQCAQQLQQVNYQRKQIDDYIIPDDKKEEIDEIIKKLDKIQLEATEKFNKITNESIKEREDECKKIEKLLVEAPLLYLCLDCNSGDNIDEELIMKRMPKFGLSYQDPDEKNYIDLLKEEYDIN
jgi:hypothetical protein